MSKSNIDVFCMTSFLYSFKFVLFHRIYLFIYLNIFILGKPIIIFAFLLGAQQNKSKNMYIKIRVKTQLEKYQHIHT